MHRALMEGCQTHAAGAPPSFASSYPAGVFLVTSPRHLRPVVAQLRANRRLKAGRNVTVFDAAHFAEVLPDTPHTESPASRSSGGACGVTLSPCVDEGVGKGGTTQRNEHHGALRVTRVRLYEQEAGEAAAMYEDCPLMTLCSDAAGQHLLTRLRTPRPQRQPLTASADADVGATSSSAWPAYMAVHVTGEFSETELLALLRPFPSVGGSTNASELQQAVAYIHGVRRFHRVCCPDLTELPSALAALRQSAVRPPKIPVDASTSGPTAAAAASGDGNFTFSELFGGIGMFRDALEALGGRSAFAVEFAPPAQMVYALNHTCWHDCPAAMQLPNAKETSTPPPQHTCGREDRRMSWPPLLVGDLTEIPSAFFPRHDVLTGGFPCQSFAKAGSAAEGLRAEKGWLFYEVVRVLAAAQPAAFLLENVEHLVEVEAGAQLAEILYRLQCPTTTATITFGKGYTDAEGDSVRYDVRHMVVDGAALTPQTRRRVYFFGLRKSPPLSSRSEDENGRTALEAVVADALRRLKKAAASAPYRCVQDLLTEPSVRGGNRQHEGRKDAALSAEAARGDLQLTAAQWEAVRRSHTFRQNPQWRLCDLRGRARTLLGSYRTSYQLYSEFVPFAPTSTLEEVVRQLTTTETSPDCTADATTAATTTDTPPPLRFLSIRECARLQGIRDTFCFPHADRTPPAASHTLGETDIAAAVLRRVPQGAVYRLIGNAVNPRVVECMAAALVAQMRRARQ